MLKILNNCRKCKPCTVADIVSNLEKFRNCLRYLLNKNAFSEEVYSRGYSKTAATPSLYELLKLNKRDIPLRHIFSRSGSYNHECARWLTQSLSDLRQHPSNIPDTFQFLYKISNCNFSNQTMVSFDAFTSIPTTYTINLILDSIFANTCTD